MTLFSQRHGYKPVKNVIQTESMDQDLRTGLWNALDISYWHTGKPYELMSNSYNHELSALFDLLWLDYFKQRIDTIPERPYEAERQIRDYSFSCRWSEVYDIVEFIASNYPRDYTNDEFISYCNSILEREVSGYRFIGKAITPITNKGEIAEIEEALRVSRALKPVAIHLNSALEKFSDRESPDYRNSIKESISAVEAISSQIAGKDKAELAEALKTLSGKIQLHTALRQGFIKLYGYTSDAEGIRHALLEEAKLDFEDAKFMLVACSAFINYLKVKASKAGIDLT